MTKTAKVFKSLNSALDEMRGSSLKRIEAFLSFNLRVNGFVLSMSSEEECMNYSTQ